MLSKLIETLKANPRKIVFTEGPTHESWKRPHA